ncbi:O-antigen ligase family protein [Clostridium prolinivorans]|uniref:O-antigen ligase family protein n=1 Tax=Clostridium prolinivorans TaxID=2769420 RepID=UPI000FDBDAD3|nr:O-antigen ligase family protein [Clostridium prolinivorans]
MKKISEKNIIIKPSIFFMMLIYPFMHNIIFINFSKGYNLFYLSISFLLMGVSAKNLLTSRTHEKISIGIKIIAIIIIFVIIQNIITIYTAENLHFILYLKQYVFPISICMFFFSYDKMFINSSQINVKIYYFFIIIYILINFIGVYCELVSNEYYIKYILGQYYFVNKGIRFGQIRFSGMFCWPNAFAYVTGAIYFVIMNFKEINKMRFLLIPLIILSGNRSVLLAIFFIEIVENVINSRRYRIREINIIIFVIILVIFINKDYIVNLVASVNNELGMNKDNYRSYIMNQAIIIFKQNFIFGIGLNRFSSLYLAIRSSDPIVLTSLASIPFYLSTSDIFYTVICEIGIVGISFWIIIMLKLIKLNKSKIIEFIIYFLVIAYSDSNPLSNYYTIVMYAIFFSYIFYIFNLNFEINKQK